MDAVKDQTTISLDGDDVASIELKEAYFLMRWPTQSPDEEVFKSLGEFYSGLKDYFGEDFKKVDKPPNSVALFDVSGKIIEVPLEDFLEQEKLQERVNDIGAVLIKVDTPYADLLYDFHSDSDYREVSVVSHLDLSQQLPTLMQQTHAGTIAQESLPELKQGLELALGRYGK